MQNNLFYLNTSANAACEIIALLPSSDLVEELKNLIHTSAYVTNLMLLNSPLTEQECQPLILDAKQVELEALRLRYGLPHPQVELN